MIRVHYCFVAGSEYVIRADGKCEADYYVSMIRYYKGWVTRVEVLA